MSEDKKNLKLNRLNKNVRIYTAIIALLPIISIYSSGIPGINLGELFLIIFLGYSIIFRRKDIFNRHKAKEIILLGWYIVISTLFGMIFDSSQINDVIFRTIRFLFYIFIIFYLSRKFFSIDYAIKLIKKISVFATVYILVQNIVYRMFGILLKGFLPFIPVYTSQYETFNYEEMYKMMFYRPTSFFLEPSHYCQYVLIGLVIYLFREKLTVKNLGLAALLTLGIIISTSGQGVFIAGMIWIIYILHLIFNFDNSAITKSRLAGFLLLTFGFVILPFILNSEVLQNTLSRVFSSSSNSAVSARSEGYMAFILNDNTFTKIFGVGFGNTPINKWFSGLAYILYCSGIIGFILLMYIFLKYYLKSHDKYVKMLIFLCFILSVSAEIINSYWIVLMFSLFCYSNKLPINNEIADKRGEDQATLNTI